MGLFRRIERTKYEILIKWVQRSKSIIRWFVKYNIDNINDISVIAPYMEIQHFKSEELKNTYNSILNNSEENYKKLKNTYNNPYIHHFAGTSTELRISESKKYLKENSSNSSNSTGMIVGIVLGSIIFIILIYYLIYRK